MTVKIHHPWDTHNKLLILKSIKSLVALALPGAEVDEIALDKELKVKTLVADYFFRVVWEGIEFILHIEFQRGQDDDMGRRMWQYNSNKDQMAGMPVLSLLIYLVPQDNLVESPYIRKVKEWGHTFTFMILKVWEIDPEDLKEPDCEGLLPLLPLAKGGRNRQAVEDMFATMQARNREDLFELGYAFADLVLTKKKDKTWLKEITSMLHTLPILQQTSVVQDWMARGREEGFQELAIDIVAERFRKLESLARTIVPTIEDEARLQTLIKKLTATSSRRRARKVLEAFALTPEAVEDSLPSSTPASEQVANTPKKTLSNIFRKMLFWRRVK